MSKQPSPSICCRLMPHAQCEYIAGIGPKAVNAAVSTVFSKHAAHAIGLVALALACETTALQPHAAAVAGCMQW